MMSSNAWECSWSGRRAGAAMRIKWGWGERGRTQRRDEKATSRLLKKQKRPDRTNTRRWDAYRDEYGTTLASPRVAHKRFAHAVGVTLGRPFPDPRSPR